MVFDVTYGKGYSIDLIQHVGGLLYQVFHLLHPLIHLMFSYSFGFYGIVSGCLLCFLGYDAIDVFFGYECDAGLLT